jgi:two-component system cell cycle response regulator
VQERILIIEDNPTNLDLITYLLTSFGYHPLHARDGEDGLIVTRRERPDLVICDIQLPGIDGFEVVRQLKSDPVLREIPLLAVTAMAMVGDRDKILAAGFDGYLTKPINPETFVNEIEAFLSRGRHSETLVSHSGPAEGSAGSCTIKIRKILIVDNLATNRELARSLFEPSGYQVVEAAGIKEALQILDKFTPDLIMSDVCMLDGSGYDFLQLAKENSRLSGIPFVLITSTMWSEEHRRKGLALGAAKFIFRPIASESLLAEIEGCLKEGDSAM